MTVTWSLPPMVASTARISGSAKAALTSAARSTAVASSRRVVGYSTGTSPVTSSSRWSACSCTAAPTAGAANAGDSTATLSPGAALAGWSRSGLIPSVNSSRTSTDTGFPPPGLRTRASDGSGRAAQGVERASYVVVGGAPVAHRDPHDRAVVPARAGHPGGAVLEEDSRDGSRALVVSERQTDLGELHLVEHLDAGDLRGSLGEGASVRGEPLDHRDHPAPAEAAQSRPRREATTAPGELWHALLRIVRGLDQVVAVHRHRRPERVAVADDGQAAVIGDV